jgi:hypothetical protein
MNGAITFLALNVRTMPELLSAVVQCHDCGEHKSLAYAASHGWRMVEREMGSQVVITDYLCGDCCEVRVIDHNQALEEQVNDL